MHERRLEARLAPGGVRARLRLGDRLSLVDVTSSGALVDAGRPLRPGSRVDVQIESERRNGLVTARVLRCSVVAIEPERGVTYRAALVFGEPCEWLREEATHGG